MAIRVGAHVSIAGSLDRAIDRAVEIGAECIQVFGSAPQQWQFLLFPEEQVEAFKRKAREHNIFPIFVHSIYLINLASENPYILDKSLTSLIQFLKFSSLINADGVVFHIGSHKGRGWKAVRGQVFAAIAEILERTALPTPQPRQGNTSEVFEDPTSEVEELAGLGNLILENRAGAGGIIGARFSELGEIIRAVKNPRIKVCLDTAHAFESGYSLFAGNSPRRSHSLDKTRKLSDTDSAELTAEASEMFGRTDSLDETLAEFEKEIGLERLVLIHANDSETPFGSGLDRHENIGEGYIGEDGFRAIVNHPSLKHLPFIIETPGFDDRGIDRKNLEVLRRLVELSLAAGS